MSTPQSTIYICSGVRLDNRYEHSIYFENATAQQGYFAGKVVKTFSAYSYLRKSWPLQVEATMEQAKTWSYLFFRNGTGKYYYYFINQVEYKNDNMVELTLELDVLQTYLFDFSLKECFVERQHTWSDEPGDFEMDEGLEVGELTNNRDPYTWPLTSLAILVLASINPNHADTEKPVQALSGKYNNVFSGLKVWAVDADNMLGWGNWGAQLENLSDAGFIDGIVNMWMYPKTLIKLGGENEWGDDDLCKTVDGAQTLTLSPLPPVLDSVDGYTPKNKKLLGYPYNFAYISNNAGGSAVIRYERSKTFGMPNFKMTGSISPDGTVFLHPVDYNGAPDNYDEGLSLGNFPTCAWDSDTYRLWLAQNQNQLAHANDTALIKSGAGAIASVGSALTGNLMGAVGGLAGAYSGLADIQALNAQKADMAIQPPQARGQFSSSINMAMGRQSFTVYYKCVTYEQAWVLDNYFTKYGYKLNRVLTPDIHARKAFTYVKTIGCLVAGSMCTEDMVKIESIFDKGVTWWADGDKIGDYSQDNSI